MGENFKCIRLFFIEYKYLQKNKTVIELTFQFFFFDSPSLLRLVQGEFEMDLFYDYRDQVLPQMMIGAGFPVKILSMAIKTNTRVTAIRECSSTSVQLLLYRPI